MKTFPSARPAAFSLMELLILLGVLFILAAMCVPYQSKSKARAHRINCVSNLKGVGLSYRQWALDNQEKYPMQVAVTNGGVKGWIQAGYFESPYMVMSNELNTPKKFYGAPPPNNGSHFLRLPLSAAVT